MALIAVLSVLSVLANFDIAGMLLGRQDFPLLGLELILVALVIFSPFAPTRPIMFGNRTLILKTIAMVAVCWWGHRAVLFGFDHARDEQMAVFDSIVFAHGRLVWPLPPAWQEHADALNLRFMLPVTRPEAWISAYLPGNAMLRAVVGKFADPALTGPLLSALALYAVWRCARLLWPEDREAASIAVLTLALSGQVVLTGMTAFAMPAHLAANLLWLWLFLKRGRATDLAALIVGFLATGLHQPLPHPMFVAPFFLLMLAEKQWARLAVFTVGYGAIMAFWMIWPHLMIGLVAGPHSIVASGTGYTDRLGDMLASNYRAIPVMAANLLRFATWQWLGFIPLLLAGFRATRHHRMAQALAGGILLTVAVMTVILASQGYGFGYRYLHGLLGNAALLSGYGWRALAGERDRLRPFIWRGATMSLLLQLPVQMYLAHQQYGAYAEAEASIAASGTDYVLVDQQHAPFLGDLALNQPDLSNRPIRLIASSFADLERIARFVCANHASIAVPHGGIYAGINRLYRVDPGPMNAIDQRSRSVFAAAGCRVAAP
ncbi:hypothetical protein H5V43_11155 [Sphingobium fuliginis]|uniref:Glycosyltransferase RgtA/B/C/D-like domain-containing protein n=1 Tax=Sphingobium fuliginis (strain ATCC 27551) TaxID=336203 RepID=A0A7M2GF84_SPHSA|nr:hypothetical protein [Sphingobium fuliginis]QOT70689.1 hypothetical protein H5V43_11155 [Sphingobium fuliginis]